MKREGKQHGMVRSNNSDITGYAKAPAKPTGHSKHTGKCRKARCGQCHSHPVSKSRDKAKGTYKLKSSDVVLNHRLVTWRVVADRNAHWSKYSGVSATGVLDALLTDSSWSQGDDDDNHEEQEYGIYEDCLDEHTTEEGIEDERSTNGPEEEEEEEEEDDDMGFCEVGFVWEYMDEEGWCVVDEM